MGRGNAGIGEPADSRRNAGDDTEWDVGSGKRQAFLAAAADTARSAIEPPAIVVVGPVVGLRRELDWLGKLAAGALGPAR